MLAFFYCLNFQKMLENSVTSIFIQGTMENVTLKQIKQLPVSNLFPLEVVQKCQHCQLCVLRENSNVAVFVQIHYLLTVQSYTSI